MSGDVKLPPKQRLKPQRAEQLADHLVRQLAHDVAPKTGRQRRFGARSRLALAAGLAASLALALAALVGVWPSLNSGRKGSHVAVAEVLTQASRTALDVDLKPGQYYYKRARLVLPELGNASGVKSFFSDFGVPGPESDEEVCTQTGDTVSCHKKGAITGKEKDAYLVRGSYVEEGWLGPDKSGRARLNPDGKSGFYDDGNRQKWEKAGSPTLVPPDASIDKSFPPRRAEVNTGLQRLHLTQAQVERHADDPDTLLETVLASQAEEYGRPPDEPPRDCKSGAQQGCAEIFAAIADAIAGSTGESGPRARGALLAVAARLPGIELVDEEATDHEGRSGQAVQLGERKLIFDPGTHELLEEQSLVGESSDESDDDLAEILPFKKGDVFSWTTVLDEGVVDSTSQRPKDDVSQEPGNG